MKIIVVILLSFFPASLRHGYDNVSAGKKMKIFFKKIDTSCIAVFQYDKADTFHFKKGDRPANLSPKEINKIELLIDSAVAEKQKKRWKILFHWRPFEILQTTDCGHQFTRRQDCIG